MEPSRVRSGREGLFSSSACSSGLSRNRGRRIDLGLVGAVLPWLARVQCRILLLAAIGPCARRHFISFSNGEKETKQRKRLQTLARRCRPRTAPPVVRQ